MELKRVVVTGLGALTPVGNTLDQYWQGLISGSSGAGPITRFDASKFKTRFACEVKGFDPLQFIERKEARKLDLFSQFAMVVADEAIADSGLLSDETVNKDRIGVIFGAGIGGLQTFHEEIGGFATGDGTPRFNPFFIPKMIIDIAPGHISIKHGLRGVNYSVVSACATSAHAIADAYHTIQLGKATAIVAGGAEAAITVPGMGGFNALKALSERNDDPLTASRPFDKDRDGFVLGEGGGCLILEEYEHAKARGAKIYCEIVGAAATADAYHMTAPHPEGLSVARVMEEAIQEAGIKPEEIGYINVHGTSTPLGDIAEVRAIEKVFKEHTYSLNISSTKSMTGHLLGAAGAIEAIACIMALKEGIIPPTINHFTDDEEFDPKINLTFNKAQKKNIRYAINNAFGFGGHNSSLLFKRWED